MTDFFDWLTASDSGLAADRLASAYNLSPSELQDTAQALAPAFSLAMMRAMSNPVTAANISQQFAPFFGSMDPTSRKAASMPEVKSLTDSLFGSNTLVDAVSRQVSSVTGTAPDTVRPLMRNLTLMAMQTMMQMVGTTFLRGPQNGEFDPTDVPANVADLMRRSANAIEAFARTPGEAGSRRTGSEGLSNVFADAFQGPLPWLPPMPFMAAKNAIAPKEEERTRSSETGGGEPPTLPFFAIFEGFSKGLSAKTSATPANEATEDDDDRERSLPEEVTKTTEPPPLVPDPAGFGRLMDASAEMQADYLKRMTELFEANPLKDGETKKG
ncbi:hypothetical protein FP2506_15774 [Fulvimarina pelagi HTCC2506]|uniref:DUF937 domain-containing protein n=1 Tax=Fulvimarina pelagi HTCC2506 TaxID=314231 RepID=Q0G3C5_9HYPH|nr:hypothetical protein [Fulvimarina pelagi]EAU41906.1 hypothetical protein FP2506_15774 [Fulvimarina pelagi HTCC2506]